MVDIGRNTNTAEYVKETNEEKYIWHKDKGWKSH